MAELIIDGKKHGIQAFLVQLRSFENHMPMKGLKNLYLKLKNMILND